MTFYDGGSDVDALFFKKNFNTIKKPINDDLQIIKRP